MPKYTCARRVTYLKSGDPVPDFPPRRYPDNRGYVRLRWTVGRNREVEVWEHRVRDGFVVDAEHVHHDNHVPSDNRQDNLIPLTAAEHLALHGVERRKDWDKVVDLYRQGCAIPEISRLLGRNPGNVSRILAWSGVEIRPVSHRYPMPSRQDVEREYPLHVSAASLAQALGCKVTTVRRALKTYGLPSYPVGNPRLRGVRDERSVG
jgi:hypothetical protein